MATQTQTEIRAAAAERQRRRRARLRGETPEHRVVDCPWCGRHWVPQRQGTLCSRSCIESAGRLRRRLDVHRDCALEGRDYDLQQFFPRLHYLCDEHGRGTWQDRLWRMRRLGFITREQDEQLCLSQAQWVQDQWPAWE